MPRTQRLKDMVVSGDSRCPSSKCESVPCGGWEHYAPMHLEEVLSTEICNGMSHWDAWVTLNSCVRQNYSMPPGSHCFCYKPDLLKCIVPGMQCPKREKVGILIWHIPPAVPLLTLDSAAFPGQHVWYLQPGQIPTEGSGHKCNFFFFLEKKTIPYKFLLNTGVFFLT